jgi:AcrR family transcriptional regulator
VPRGRVRDGEAQQRIIDATFALLGTSRAGGVSIDEIALVAEVGKQTIYRWWPSKHALIVDALLHHSMKDTPLRDTGNARADLRNHMRGVVRLFTSSTGVVIREVIAATPAAGAGSSDFVDRFWQPRRELTTAFLVRAIERGQVRNDIDVGAALDAIYGPLWIRLVIAFAPITYQLVDDTLDVVWPGLEA